MAELTLVLHYIRLGKRHFTLILAHPPLERILDEHSTLAELPQEVMLLTDQDGLLAFYSFEFVDDLPWSEYTCYL